MKNLFTVLMLSLSLQALAGEVVVYDAPNYELRGIGEIKKNFDINAEMGRAWVSLTFVASYSEDFPDSEERVKIPGLSYNAATKEVILDVDGEKIVCATVKKTFLGTTIKPTKKCNFSTKYYSIQNDNGYEVETIEKTKVIMNY